jgi:microcompartment protein CcmL/EutN
VEAEDNMVKATKVGLVGFKMRDPGGDVLRHSHGN